MGRLQRCVFAVGFFGVCSGGVQCSHLNAVVTNAASKPSACFILLFAGFFFFSWQHHTGDSGSLCAAWGGLVTGNWASCSFRQKNYVRA